MEITIKNNLNESIWYRKGEFIFLSNLQKFENENNEWKDVKRYSMCYCVSCARQPPYLVEMKPKEVLKDKWDMRIFENHIPLCPPSVPLASPGKYRVYFSYFLSPETEQNEIKVYSNEFVIKEKKD